MGKRQTKSYLRPDELTHLRFLKIIDDYWPQLFDDTQWASTTAIEFEPELEPDVTLDSLKTPEGFKHYFEKYKPSDRINDIWGKGRVLLDFLVKEKVLTKKMMAYEKLVDESEYYKSIIRDPIMRKVLGQKQTTVYYVDRQKLKKFINYLAERIKNYPLRHEPVDQCLNKKENLKKSVQSSSYSNNQQWSLR